MPAQAMQALGGMRNHRRQAGMTPEQQAQYDQYLSSVAAQTTKITKGSDAWTIHLPGQAPTPSSSRPPAGHTMPVPVPSSAAAAATPSSAAPAAPSRPAVEAAPSSAAREPATTSQAPPAPTTSRAAPHHSMPVKVPSSASSSSSTRAQVAAASSARASSASPSASQAAAAAAANGGSSNASGLSNGALAGIVVGLIAGILILGCLAGFLWRKHKQGKHDAQSSWLKMDNDDDDITPFPARSGEPKPTPYRDMDDSPPRSANSRALAMARQNAFFEDGTPRPDSRGPVDFGANRSYGPYPVAGSAAVFSSSTNPAYHYSPPSQDHGFQEAQDYPFIKNGGYPQQQQDGMFARQQEQGNPFADNNAPTRTSPTSGPRQLVGPGAGAAYHGSPALALTPVPLGRPQPPTSYDDIASAELYADDRYADDHLFVPPQAGRSAPQDEFDPENYTPRTAATNEWAGGAAPGGSPVSNMSLLPDATPLPALRPMSPLMGPTATSDESARTIPAKAFGAGAKAQPRAGAQSPAAQPNPPYYGDDKSRQMYSEVAHYAGFNTPVTPATPLAVDGNSPPPTPFEQPQIMHASRLPAPPYQHGQPLAPLTEVATPKSDNISLVPSMVEAAPTHRRLPTPPRVPGAGANGASDDAYDGI